MACESLGTILLFWVISDPDLRPHLDRSGWRVVACGLYGHFGHIGLKKGSEKGPKMDLIFGPKMVQNGITRKRASKSGT